MIRSILPILTMTLVAQSALAQANPGIFFLPQFPPDLAKYLDLKQEQIDSISSLNNVFERFRAQKNGRMGDVNQEIAYWTAQEPIDPLQLGVRYTEIEAIRREIADQEKRTTAQVMAILTDVQKSRVKALDDARKLASLITAAECHRILGSPAPTPGSIIPGLILKPYLGFDFSPGTYACLTASFFPIPQGPQVP